MVSFEHLPPRRRFSVAMSPTDGANSCAIIPPSRAWRIPAERVLMEMNLREGELQNLSKRRNQRARFLWVAPTPALVVGSVRLLLSDSLRPLDNKLGLSSMFREMQLFKLARLRLVLESMSPTGGTLPLPIRCGWAPSGSVNFCADQSVLLQCQS